LIAGGRTGADYIRTIELYRPADNRWFAIPEEQWRMPELNSSFYYTWFSPPVSFHLLHHDHGNILVFCVVTSVIWQPHNELLMTIIIMLIMMI
jgi:hypothetical protein